MRRAWVLLGVVALVAAWSVPAGGAELSDEEIARIRQRLTQVENQSVLKAGETVYRVACATCHGIDGDGSGPESDGFAQAPTDFTKGAFKLRSAVGPWPVAGDIERTIRQGMPGTEMVPFEGILTNESITAVAQYVKTFSPYFEEPDAGPAPEDIVEIPEERPFPRTAQSIAAGKALYEEFECAECHGPQGRGVEGEVNLWGVHVEMLSFTEGVFKSGPADRDLFRSIAAGMDSTTMEPYIAEMSPEEIWRLVDYIRSLEHRPSGFFGSVVNYLFGEEPSGFAYGRH